MKNNVGRRHLTKKKEENRGSRRHVNQGNSNSNMIPMVLMRGMVSKELPQGIPLEPPQGEILN